MSDPFDRWPTGRLIGFEYFYGFLGGETSQWEPAPDRELRTDIEPPEPRSQGYQPERRTWSDKALAWLDSH